MAEHMPGDMG